MKPITNCKECGSTDLSWGTHNKVRGDIVQGRLNSNDVTCLFVLGCNHCSETLATIPADKVAESMNGPSPSTTITGVQMDAGAAVLAGYTDLPLNFRNAAIDVFHAMTEAGPRLDVRAWEAPSGMIRENKRDLLSLGFKESELTALVPGTASDEAIMRSTEATIARLSAEHRTALLTAAHTLLKKQAWESDAINLLHVPVTYEGTERDGLRLIADIEDELEIDGDARPA